MIEQDKKEQKVSIKLDSLKLELSKLKNLVEENEKKNWLNLKKPLGDEEVKGIWKSNTPKKKQGAMDEEKVFYNPIDTKTISRSRGTLSLNELIKNKRKEGTVKIPIAKDELDEKGEVIKKDFVVTIISNEAGVQEAVLGHHFREKLKEEFAKRGPWREVMNKINREALQIWKMEPNSLNVKRSQ